MCRGLKFGKVDPEIVGNFLGNSKVLIFVQEIDCRFKRSHNRCAGRQIIQTLYIFPVSAQTFLRLNFMQFFGNFDKIVCWRPLLREILDLPMLSLPNVRLFSFAETKCIF